MTIKQTLEILKKPFDYLDEQVLRQYTKVGTKIPEKNLYKLTSGMQFYGIVGTSTASDSLGLPIVAGFIEGMVIHGPDFCHNINGLLGMIDDNASSDAIVVNPDIEFFKSYNRKIRLPVFLAGIVFLGKGIYDIANYFINNEPLHSNAALDIISGTGFLSFASSMYLKDRNPKLLNKVPLWKRAYNSIRDKINAKVPALKPVPIPVQVHAVKSTLESRLHSQNI